jgi:hypothetical protein
MSPVAETRNDVAKLFLKTSGLQIRFHYIDPDPIFPRTLDLDYSRGKKAALCNEICELVVVFL